MDALAATVMSAWDGKDRPVAPPVRGAANADAARVGGAPPPSLVATYAQLPFTLVEGRGARVRDDRGREYWDFYGGHAVTLLGHSHPEVARAVQEQAGTLTFYSNVVPIEVRTRAAQRLCAFAPPPLQRVFFCNSGSEANENALKIAMLLSGRSRIAAVHGGWHGRSLLCLSATTDEKLTRPFAPLLCECVTLRPNHPEDAARIDESVAAVLVEPIQSIAGIVEMQAAFLAALRARCDQTGTVLIYDEIQTGLGRLGRPFAAGQDGVLPDMMTLAKGLANGVPIGAVLLAPAWADRLKVGDLGTTFGGGPLACAAVLAVLDVIERERLCDHAADLGAAMRRLLRVGPVQEVRGRGCMIGLRVTGQARDVQAALLERGFITGTSAAPDVLRLLPPINTPLEPVAELGAALRAL
jgi:acetylornithine/N-succinyldiaminopimelate aminotransferase